MSKNFREYSSIKRLPKDVSNLENAFELLLNTFRYDDHKNAPRLSPMSDVRRHLVDVRICLNNLLEISRGSGRIDTLAVSLLETSHTSLHLELRPLGELLINGEVPLSGHPRFAKVIQATGKLGESVRTVMKALDRQTEADMELDPYYEIPRILREAVKRRDSRLGEELRLKGRIQRSLFMTD